MDKLRRAPVITTLINAKVMYADRQTAREGAGAVMTIR